MSWEHKPFTPEEREKDARRCSWSKYVESGFDRDRPLFRANAMGREQTKRWEEKHPINTSRDGYGMKGVEGYLTGRQKPKVEQA